MNLKLVKSKWIEATVRRFVFAMFFATLAGATARGQNSKGSFLVGAGADKLWNLMAEAPYAQNGDHGLIIYMNSYSACGNCIVFLRDFWESRKSKIQLREIFAPVNTPQFINEAAAIALTRSPVDAEAFYKRAKVAPAANNSPALQAALQHELEFNGKLNDVLGRIGHVRDAFPTFILRETEANGENRVVVVSGWGSDFERDLEIWVDQANK